MDDADTGFEDADILIKGRVILAVGKGLESEGARVLDARGCVVIPGMVNTHHHLCQTLTRATPPPRTTSSSIGSSITIGSGVT